MLKLRFDYVHVDTFIMNATAWRSDPWRVARAREKERRQRKGWIRGRELADHFNSYRSKYILVETRETFLPNPCDPASRIYSRYEDTYKKVEKRKNALENIIFRRYVDRHLRVCPWKIFRNKIPEYSRKRSQRTSGFPQNSKGECWVNTKYTCKWRQMAWYLLVQPRCASISHIISRNFVKNHY